MLVCGDQLPSQCSTEPDVFECAKENVPQDNVDVPADDELADEMLGDVSGGQELSNFM